jgi:hypothetical protein
LARARVWAVVAAALVAAAFAGSAQPAPGKKLTIYVVATTAQFMNHADDRLRGMTTNPFNVLKGQAQVIAAGGKEKGHGPFPGDDILYSFRVYSDAKLKKHVGFAMFTCYFNFVKRATCESYFELEDGLLLASGQVVFNGTRFTLSVTGGTGRYLGALGEAKASAAARNAERLDLRLLAT